MEDKKNSSNKIYILESYLLRYEANDIYENQDIFEIAFTTDFIEKNGKTIEKVKEYYLIDKRKGNIINIYNTFKEVENALLLIWNIIYEIKGNEIFK